jgi:hypothetical protein
MLDKATSFMGKKVIAKIVRYDRTHENSICSAIIFYEKKVGLF